VPSPSGMQKQPERQRYEEDRGVVLHWQQHRGIDADRSNNRFPPPPPPHHGGQRRWYTDYCSEQQQKQPCRSRSSYSVEATRRSDSYCRYRDPRECEGGNVSSHYPTREHRRRPEFDVPQPSSRPHPQHSSDMPASIHSSSQKSGRNHYIHPKLASRFVPAQPKKNHDNLSKQRRPLVVVKQQHDDIDEASLQFYPPCATVTVDHNDSQTNGGDDLTEALSDEVSSLVVHQHDINPLSSLLLTADSPRKEDSCFQDDRSVRLLQQQQQQHPVAAATAVSPLANHPATDGRHYTSEITPSMCRHREASLVSFEESTLGGIKDDDDGAGPEEDDTPNCQQQQQQQQDCANIAVGARIAVYWDGEDSFFEGTVTNTPHSKVMASGTNHCRRRQQKQNSNSYFVEYDDGDREWIDLSETRFFLLGAKKRERQSKEQQEDDSDDDRRISSNNKRVRSETSTNACSPNTKEETRESPSFQKSAPEEETAVVVEDWVSAGIVKRPGDDDSSDSDTDDEEVMRWAVTVFGIPRVPPLTIAHPKSPPTNKPTKQQPVEEFRWEDWMELGPVHIPISEAVKLGRRRSTSSTEALTVVTTTESKSFVKRAVQKKGNSPDKAIAERSVAELYQMEEEKEEETRRKKELARPPTAEELRSILAKDPATECASNDWVRRSVRQPSKSALNSSMVKSLISKLNADDSDMVVLKMKKYVNDPNTPCIVIDAVLDALEENTNCQSLYIQNFNEGMRDDQVLHLLAVLQRPSCKIWCLNIGETYKVKTATWELFTEGLKKTKITHIYASEHTITGDMKDQIRKTIRNNRSRHNMHMDPDNLDTIVQCTHCWWNPINAKALRPFLTKRGLEHMLQDPELQGLRGSTSGATLT
jgi:hypothetical protein